MLGGDLREQQSAPFFGGDNQPVRADFNIVRIDGRKWRENRNFYLKRRELGRAERRKTRIVQRSALRTVRYAFSQRFARFDYANAAVEFALYFQRDKDAAPQRKTRGLWFSLMRRGIGEGTDDRRASQRQQGATVLDGKLILKRRQHPRTLRELPSCAIFCVA